MASRRIDLQIQSTASDGTETPAALARLAKEAGLAVVALTDHDTVAGVAEAIHEGERLGIRVIPGIELSVEERGVHILGYGIDYENARLLAALEDAKRGRIASAKEMVANLARAGFAVSWEDVEREATGGVVGRPHIARAILKRPENRTKLGGISSVHEFIRAYLDQGSPHYVHRPHLSAKEGIALIHHTGGVAVWSHPAVHFPGEPETLERFLKELLAWGLDGVEVFSPAHDEDDVELLLGLSTKYEILRTAGSDFHTKGEGGTRAELGLELRAAQAPGDYETYGFPVDDILPKLEEAMTQRRKS